MNALASIAVLCFAFGMAIVAFTSRPAQRLRGAALVAAGCVLQVLSASDHLLAAEGSAVALILVVVWAIELAWLRHQAARAAEDET